MREGERKKEGKETHKTGVLGVIEGEETRREKSSKRKIVSIEKEREKAIAQKDGKRKRENIVLHVQG